MSLPDFPPDTIEASGACAVGYHDSCDGYTYESGSELDADLCECECHDILAESLYYRA